MLSSHVIIQMGDQFIAEILLKSDDDTIRWNSSFEHICTERDGAKNLFSYHNIIQNEII